MMRYTRSHVPTCAYSPTDFPRFITLFFVPTNPFPPSRNSRNNRNSAEVRHAKTNSYNVPASVERGRNEIGTVGQ